MWHWVLTSGVEACAPIPVSSFLAVSKLPMHSDQGAALLPWNWNSVEPVD